MSAFTTRRKVAAVVVVMTLAVALYALRLVYLAGEFKRIDNRFDGTCRLVSDLKGPEDVVILPGGRGALFTSEDRRAGLRGDEVLGGVYFYDLEADEALPVNRVPNPPPGFHPHGLGLHEDTLMVVSHPRGNLHGDLPGTGPAHTIELFDVRPGQLTHRRTVTDPLLVTPNDVAPVGRASFYVTNDHGSGVPWMRKVEDYLRLARSHILFCDPSGCRRLPGNYEYANGIQVSADGTEVYLAAAPMQSVLVFDRDLRTNDLTVRTEVPLGTGPDNINIDDDGDLWVGAHPKLLTVAAHLAEGEGTSPTQVMRIRRGTWEVEQVLLSDGRSLGASTAAARVGDRLLVGGVFGPGFLDCRME